MYRRFQTTNATERFFYNVWQRTDQIGVYDGDQLLWRRLSGHTEYSVSQGDLFLSRISSDKQSYLLVERVGEGGEKLWACFLFIQYGTNNQLTSLLFVIPQYSVWHQKICEEPL